MHTVSLACVKQALAEEAARLKAAVKDAQDLAKWLTLTEKQRAMAALQAGKAFYGGEQQHLMRKHGWCVKDGAAYNPAQAERAWAALIGLYARALA